MWFILILTPISWSIGAIYRYFRSRDKGIVRFSIIHVSLCFQYMMLLAYLWLPLQSFEIALYIFVFGLGIFVPDVNN